MRYNAPRDFGTSHSIDYEGNTLKIFHNFSLSPIFSDRLAAGGSTQLDAFFANSVRRMSLATLMTWKWSTRISGTSQREGAFGWQLGEGWEVSSTPLPIRTTALLQMPQATGWQRPNMKLVGSHRHSVSHRDSNSQRRLCARIDSL